MADTTSTESYLTAEARARVEIDRQLAEAGWIVQRASKVNLVSVFVGHKSRLRRNPRYDGKLALVGRPGVALSVMAIA